ncbi:MAG: TonB-dependent receptor [Adhaeribacter sp.]
MVQMIPAILRKHLLSRWRVGMGVYWLLFSLAGQAQNTFTLSGTVRDAGTGEPLVGVAVALPDLNRGGSTNENGYYSFSAPPGTHTLQYSYIGYQTLMVEVALSGNLRRNVELAVKSQELAEVLIEAGGIQEQLRSSQMSLERLSARDAKLLPALFGEVDILKTLQLKPGVQSGGEGSSGLYVRGGGPDQNLILLDEATVYNASHLFGFFSIFNNDAVRSVELYKGGFPARYGGRLSSVVEVRLRDGNNKKFAATGGVGLIASRLTLEGPLKKNKASFLLSGRRTYFDVFTRGLNKRKAGDPEYDPIPDYYFYDLNGKAKVDLGPNDQLFFSAYLGHDAFGFRNSGFRFNFNWGNQTAALRWHHGFSPRLLAYTSLTASGYQYDITNDLDAFRFQLRSDIRDLNLKSELEYIPGTSHHYKFGFQAIAHTFEVGRLKAGSDDQAIAFQAGKTYRGTELGLYAGDEFQPSPAFQLQYGLRLSGFKSDTSFFGALEPRLALRYSLRANLSLKASYTRMIQYIHLVANSGASLPTDIWYPSNRHVRPQRSQQLALGGSWSLGKSRFLVSNELYYKWMRRQVDFRDGAQLFANDNLNEEFLFGRGISYGNEFYVEKKEGRTTGWLGYTLSWTYRRFDQINEGRWFPTRYDRRHDVSVVVQHQLGKRLQAGSTWVYGTGNAFSVPVGRIFLQSPEGVRGDYVPVYSERNAYRLAPYHRLDLSLVYQLKTKRGESDLTMSIYNVYNRRNPYFVYVEELEEEETGTTTGFQGKQVSLFPIIPALTYNFKF